MLIFTVNYSKCEELKYYNHMLQSLAVCSFHIICGATKCSHVLLHYQVVIFSANNILLDSSVSLHFWLDITLSLHEKMASSKQSQYSLLSMFLTMQMPIGPSLTHFSTPQVFYYISKLLVCQIFFCQIF